MIRAGDVIVNPPMGGRMAFRKTARETDGELLQLDFFLQPRGVIVEPHVHPRQEERFEVVAGAMRGRVAGHERVARRGATVVIPPGTNHAWWNDTDEEAHLLLEFRPALRTAEFFDRAFTLARAGMTDARGVPTLLRRAVLIQEFAGEIYPAFAPLPIVRLAIALLAPIGRVLHPDG
jgi:quercetin dioxygenase-like cupin family protein